MAGDSDGFPDQHAFGSFIQDANRLHAIHGPSSSVSNQWQNDFHPPHSFNQSAGLQNEYGASSYYHARVPNMHRPGYFVYQNPQFYYSQRFPPLMRRFQHLPSQGTLNPANRFHNQGPHFKLRLPQSQNSSSSQGHFQQAMQVSQECDQQNQQISALHSQFQAPAPSDHSGMNVGSSVQAISAVATQQQYGSSQTNSHTMQIGRSVQSLPGHPQQQYGSSSAVLNASPDPSGHISIHSQRPQETFLPGYQQQQNDSPNTYSGVHPAPSEHSSAHAQRPQQTFLPGNQQQQQRNPPNANLGVHPSSSEQNIAHAQRPQQTFLPEIEQQYYTPSNTGSGVHPPSSENNVHALRPQQTFLPEIEQQYYTPSNTVSGVHQATSEQNVGHARRPQQTFISGNSLQHYTSLNTSSGVPSENSSNIQAQKPLHIEVPGNPQQQFRSANTTSNTHLTSSSQTDNLLSGIPPSTYLNLTGNLFKDNTKTTSINYRESSIAAPTSSAGHLTTMSRQQQDKEHQSIDTNNFGIVKDTGSAAYYEMLCSSQVHDSYMNPVVSYIPSVQQHSQVPVQQPYLNNSHGLHEMSSSHQSVGASLPKKGLRSKINNLVPAPLQRKRGKKRVHCINKNITPDIASVNIGNPNSHSLGSVNEYNTYQSGETELRAKYGDFNMKQQQASTNNSVNKPQWYKYPETTVVPSFQSDIEAMQTDVTNYATDSTATARFSISDPASSYVCTEIQITGNQTNSVGINLSWKGNTPETDYPGIIENRSEKQLTAPIKQNLPDYLRVPEANSSVEIMNLFSISDLSQSGVNSRSDGPQSVEVGTSQKLGSCINSSSSSNVLPANSSSIDRAVHCSSTLANPEVIPHTHDANYQLVPSLIVDSDLMKDGGLTNISNPDKVSETGVLTQNAVQISENNVSIDGVALEKDTSLVAKHQHCVFQALKPIYESRVNKKSESKLVLLPSRLQNRRNTSPYLVKNSNEMCKSSAVRLSTPRLSLDSSTSSQLQSKVRNVDAQSMCDQGKCITSNLTDSKSGRKQKHGDQEQSSSCENSLSAKEKVFNLWKMGQVMENNRTGQKIQRKESATITRKTNHSIQIAKSQQAVKSPDLKAVPTNGSAVKKPSADKTMNKAKQKVATGKTALIKAKKSNRSKIQKPASKICNVIIHGHKLLCLKSKTEDLILLSEFLFTCFPDKTVSSLNNCIDHILRIRKGVLEHPEKDTIVTFLKKQGYHMDSLHTISVNDGRKLYHHLYGIETCAVTMCVVEIPEAVSFVDLSLTKSTLKLNKEVHILEENSVNKSPVTINFVEDQEVSDIETWQSGRNSTNRQSSDVSWKPVQCVDMAPVTSDSDETLAYGECSDFSDVDEESVLNHPFVIRWLPGTPKIGGMFKTHFGNIRSYRHNGDSYLSVDDLCNIFNPTEFCERIQKENILLYSCCKEIESFLNELDSNFPPLKSQHQSLVKETDIGVHEIENNACHNSGHDKSSILKRAMYMQGDFNENSIPHKHPRLAESLPTDSHNLMILKLEPSVVTQESNCQSVYPLVKVHNPSESCPGSMLDITGLTTEATGLTTEDAHSENPPRENSQISAVTKSISCLLDKENGLTSSGDRLTVEECVNNSKKLLQHPETEMIYMTYIPIDVTSLVDTDSCCRNTDSIFDQSVIRQHDLLSPDSERSTFSPDESLINSGKLILNQGSWNSHEPHVLLVHCEDLNTISKDTLDKCLTSQVQTISVKYSGNHVVEKADNNSCHLETTDLCNIFNPTELMTNTPSETNTSIDCFDNSAAAQTEPQVSLGDYENISSQSANKQNDLSATEKPSFECSDSLTNGNSGRDNMSVSYTVNTEAGFSSTLQMHTTEDDSPSYDIILHANQSESVSDISTDNTHIVVNSTSDTHRRDNGKMVCNTVIDKASNYDQKGTEKTADAFACGKLSSEHEVLQKSSLLAGLASDVDIEADYLFPSYVQSMGSRRCVDDMDIITCSNTSMLVPPGYRKAYAKLWQQYRAVLGDNTKLTKKCKNYEGLIYDMMYKYKWGPT